MRERNNGSGKDPAEYHTGFIENSISVSFPHIKPSTPDKQKLMALKGGILGSLMYPIVYIMYILF